jgi:hypothetical protein
MIQLDDHHHHDTNKKQTKKIDASMLTKLYESPEFVRYTILTGDVVIEHMLKQNTYTDLQDPMGKMLSTSLTTFLSMPSARAISLSLQTFFHHKHAHNDHNDHNIVELYNDGRKDVEVNVEMASYVLSAHPRPRYQNAEMQILSTLGKVPGGRTKLSMRIVNGAVHGSVSCFLSILLYVCVFKMFH